MSKKRMFAEIAKVEDQEDGTIKVWGYASSGAVDSDGEIVTPDAMKAALPDYMKFGAVREMHQPSAAGTAIEAEVQDDGKTWFGAHVVDPVAVTKVKTNVYKGFSIGGKVTERDPMDKKVIKGLNLVEVSLVDRPANPEALLTVFKAERTPQDYVEELAEMLDAGQVTPQQLVELAKAAQEQPAGAQDGSTAAADDAAKGQASAETSGATTDSVKKGMYSVADFASVLNSISYMASDAGWEAQYEGDNSPIPAALLKWLQDGVEIFKAMAAEETAEMVANLRAVANLPEVITLSDSVAAKAAGTELAKAGARFSKATKDALGKIHAACKEASAHLDDLKYADDDVESSAAADTTKAATAGAAADTNTDEAISKAVSSAIAPLTASLEKLGKENEGLRKQVDELGKRAAPGRALLKAVAITKQTDAAPADEAEKSDAMPAEGTPERAAYEMRKVFKGGGVRLV